MQYFPTDTGTAAESTLIELARRAPVWKRIAQVPELNRACRMLALADLRRRYPLASEEEVRRRLIARLLSRDGVIRAYGWDPKKGVLNNY